MSIDEAREAAITDIAKTIARIAEGDEAGWGIYADIVRVGLSTNYAKFAAQDTKRSVIHGPMAGDPRKGAE